MRKLLGFVVCISLISCERIGEHAKNIKKKQIVVNVSKPEKVQHQIKLVFLGNVDDEDYDGALVFKDYVESQSNGSLRVKIFPGGQLCGQTAECVQALQAGVIEVFMTTLGGFGNFFPEIQALDLPYMFESDREVEKVYTGPLLIDLRQAIFERTGLRLMTMTNTGGWRNIANVKKQVRTPKDLNGLKLRTINSEVQIKLVELLGANPTPVSWPELYTSLATGVVDGSKNGITDIVGMKFHEHIKHITLDGHAYMSALWLMSGKKYKQLSDIDKKIVADGFEALRNVTIAFPKRRQIEAYNAFRNAGGTIYVPTTEEKAQFVKASKPIYDWYAKKYGDIWLKKLEKAKKLAQEEMTASNKFKTETL